MVRDIAAAVNIQDGNTGGLKLLLWDEDVISSPGAAAGIRGRVLKQEECFGLTCSHSRGRLILKAPAGAVFDPTEVYDAELADGRDVRPDIGFSKFHLRPRLLYLLVGVIGASDQWAA